jgi:hypothetical protein
MTLRFPNHLAAASACALALAALLALPASARAGDGAEPIAGSAGVSSNLDFRGYTGLSGFRAGSGMAWLTYDGSSYGCGNSSAGGGRRELFYPFTLPEDSRNQFVRVWGFKAGGTPDVVVSAVRACMSQSQTQPVLTPLDTVTITSSPGEFTTFLGFDDTPAPLDCRYWVSLAFGDANATCTTSADSLRLTRVRVQTEVFDRILRSGFHSNVP